MIEISTAARTHILHLQSEGKIDNPALRVGLGPARPSGEHDPRGYQVALVELDERERTEIVINVDEIRIFLNMDSTHFLSGGLIDWDETEESFNIRKPQADRERPSISSSSYIPDTPEAKRVQRILDETINPAIAAHGGYVEIVSLHGDTLEVRMGGGCQGCAASQVTLRQGVERMIRAELPEIEHLVDVTDHTAGANPYY